jgi:hypothetical protein
MLLLTRLALVGVIAALIAGASLPERPRHADAKGAADPEALVEQVAQMLSIGDATGLTNLAAEDFVFRHTGVLSFAAVGRPAFASVIDETVAANPSVEVVETEAAGNVVTGSWEWSDDDTEAAGVERYIEIFEFELNEAGKFVRADVQYDLEDPDTLIYAEYQAGLERGGEEQEPPEGFVSVSLAAQPGGSQPGLAFVLPFGELTGVGIEIAPGADGVLQPAHFHTGTCGQPGPIVQPLASVLDGSSFTLLSAGADELDDAGLIINVHKSQAEPGAYVACGEVLSAAAAPPPPPAATATSGTGVTAPDTGTGSAAGGGSPLYTWLAAALALGAIAVTGGAVVRRRHDA